MHCIFFVAFDVKEISPDDSSEPEELVEALRVPNGGAISLPSELLTKFQEEEERKCVTL